MKISTKKEHVLLLLGDIFFLYLSLGVTLVLRYGRLPFNDVLKNYVYSFSLLFVVWILVFFIAGLYEKHTTLFKRNVTGLIVRAQIVNALLAVLFFYLIPYFGITPKTNLFIFLLISSVLLFLWRLVGLGFFGSKRKQAALLVGTGPEMEELFQEINSNDRYSFRFSSFIDVAKGTEEAIQEEIDRAVHSGISTIVIDLKDDRVSKVLSELYKLIFSHAYFIDIHEVYENVFDRVPLSLVRHGWFLENIYVEQKSLYDWLRRGMDLMLSFLLGIISLIFYPFIYVAIKLDDKGRIFVTQVRIGENDKPVKLFKFRSMSFNDGGDQARVAENKITRVGSFIRKTRLDELPQLWNVFRGDLSLIGPRPELPALVEVYEKEIPYYKVRHLIKPGLSGWAQLYHKNPPKVTTNLSETRNKLSYDLYYIKNRSLTLDIKIALKTLKIFMSRSGV